MLFVLVAVDDSKELTAVELCKEFEQFDGVKGAVIVRAQHNATVTDQFVGEFYTTDAAMERLDKNASRN